MIADLMLILVPFSNAYQAGQRPELIGQGRRLKPYFTRTQRRWVGSAAGTIGRHSTKSAAHTAYPGKLHEVAINGDREDPRRAPHTCRT